MNVAPDSELLLFPNRNVVGTGLTKLTLKRTATTVADPAHDARCGSSQNEKTANVQPRICGVCGKTGSSWSGV